MAGSKEIRTKIKSVENTRKITKAMEMVAASKMRKAQDRMRASRPYADKIRNVAAHLSFAQSEYRHPFLIKRDVVKNIGLIVVSSDKGLCGGLNTNVLRLSLNQMKAWEAEGKGISVSAIGNKGYGFMNRIGAQVKSHITGLGDTPQLEKLIGSIKVMLDAYIAGEIDQLYICYTKFINTMKQEPTMQQLLPLSGEQLGSPNGHWDYIYEPEAKPVVDELMTRYIESLIYNAVAENMASEQSARMVAMKSASDNAKSVIGELKLVYNKARQAAITKEISEIVGGAAAVSS
ncbi:MULTISPECIES: F0F1 ATP synthase subunit gamma [unclassified Methylophilus]|jgi:F-type H+-transporting ATPase subunit gamma|uniref:F0F1 ATP synthase subunit gamma n=1 Tax=unclassified Methylophilus TaxID=2630143 RepID=UPI00070100F1|nr:MULTISPECIES: F0F1 ATP synthase subunit gamma [unclassified Methylophilus]KQT36518.1 ATP F0F1 synthase subunit gamma [Methylophilus sp. Leaf414]KQT41398.1 ATP F0F1 synthase subunit gamma [Methylophilus sp. Leaf416]KQT57919.1 ATP F0F1 synthase subunit gamma [Methylophilus sp. Leaf459]|eukprot:GDKJ01047745.1.p1 GENE.GDKJ01047745.1~~GDKJ01047745.1.p1  ORF type:complete len:290 (+),score=27.28 GDKJ01047745.1:79-948(+)